MKFTSKEFLWVQAGIILFVLATMDCIIRGPMYQVQEQLETNVREYNKNVLGQISDLELRVMVLSRILEQEAKWKNVR